MKIAELQALLTPARLDAIAARWGAPGGGVRFLRGVENHVYAFEVAQRPLILRCTHSSHRSTGQVTAELEFVDFLGHEGVTVARAVPSLSGGLTEHLAVDDTYFSAAVFERAPGAKPTFDLPPDAQATLYRDWGKMMGAMHRQVPRYRQGRGDPRRHVGIEDDIIRNAATYLPARLHHLLSILAGLQREVRQFSTTPLHYGLLHTDCHQGNFHVDGRLLTLFDFDDCCHHWFAYDLTIPVWHFPLVNRGLEPARDREALSRFFREFVRGYQEENVFQREWLEQMQWFIRLRDLQLFIFAWKIRDPANPQPWHGQFMRDRGALIESGRPSIDLNWAELI